MSSGPLSTEPTLPESLKTNIAAGQVNGYTSDYANYTTLALHRYAVQFIGRVLP